MMVANSVVLRLALLILTALVVTDASRVLRRIRVLPPTWTRRSLIQPRRQALTIEVGDFFSFCWKDRDIRKATPGLHLLNRGDCESGNTTGSILFCYESCPDGLKGLGPMCTWDCAAHGKFDCGAACADTKEICVDAIERQIVDTTTWLTNILVPGSGALTQMSKGTGAAMISSTSPTSLTITPGDMFQILIDTLDARGRVASAFAFYNQLLGSNPALGLSIQLSVNLAAALVEAMSKHGVTINIENIAKIDSSGTAQVLLAFSHARCSRAECMQCDTIFSTCQDKTECTNGQCGPTVFKRDGAACVVGDGQGNTLPGFCQAGACNITVAKYYVDQAENSTIWAPGSGGNSSDGSGGNGGIIRSLADRVAVAPGLYATQGVEGVSQLAYNVWKSTSSDAGSCMFFNGGCGTAPCEIDVDSKTKTCVDVGALGFQPGPFSTDYPSLPSLDALSSTSPTDCLSACNAQTDCKLVVTTQAGDCWLKSELPSSTDAVIVPFYQSYIKL